VLEIKAIYRFVKKSLIWLAKLPFISDLRKSKAKKYITILLYHQIEPNLFESHLKYLNRTYTVVPMREIFEAHVLGTRKSLPENSLVITFDDGWKSNFKLLPVLRKHDCRVTIFLTAGLVGTNRKIWNYAIETMDKIDIDRLKTVPVDEKDKILNEKYGHYPEKEYEERSMLNLQEIEEMRPYVDFQSHGMFHNVLPMCSEQQLAVELSESKKTLSKILGSEIYAIAYPFNRANQREIEAANAAGYRLGRVGWRRLNKIDGDPMTLKAIGVKSNSSVNDLIDSIVWAQTKEFFNID